MAYSDQEWETVRAFYERGFSLAEIVARPEVSITDRSSISKRAKLLGWVKGEKSTLVDDEVESKQKLAQVVEKKSTLNSTELEVHNTVVTERIQDSIYFRNATILVTNRVIEKVRTEDLSMAELNMAQTAIGKGKETVCGKSPDTAIQINNAPPFESEYLKKIQGDFER